MIELGGPKRARCLEVVVGGNAHAVPLAANLPVPFARKLRVLRDADGPSGDEAATEFFMEYFGAYLGSDMDLLDMEDFAALVAAWNAESKAGGVTAGESQASPA